MAAQGFLDRPYARPLAGLVTVLALALIVLLAVGLFRDSFRETMPVTVIADRAGLVMNPDAKVKLHGAQVGKVASIEPLADGGAALHLAIDPESVDALRALAALDVLAAALTTATAGATSASRQARASASFSTWEPRLRASKAG